MSSSANDVTRHFRDIIPSLISELLRTLRDKFVDSHGPYCRYQTPVKVRFRRLDQMRWFNKRNGIQMSNSSCSEELIHPFCNGPNIDNSSFGKYLRQELVVFNCPTS